MAEEPRQKPTISATAQAALVRQMLLDDPRLTLEGIETDFPEYAEGVKQLLSERGKPAKAGSGSGPMQEIRFADVL